MRIRTGPVSRLACLITWAAVGMVAISGASGTTQAPDIAVQKLGPQIGERVPDFVLKDHAGRSHTLQSIMGPKGAMLVFYRSADW